MSDDVQSLRQRRQWIPVVLAAAVMAFTFSEPIANALRPPPPTAAELQREEQSSLIEQRKARLAQLLAIGDHCRPAIAHELARTLVFDGQSAFAYATDYEQRCAPDPVVHAWGTAKIPHRHPAVR